MALTVSDQPYEFLARWDQTGNLVGAHIQRRFVTRNGDTIVAEAVGQPQPVALDGNGDFPLADIMTEVQVGAIAQANALTAQVTEAQTALATAIAERDAALARVAELEAVQPSG